VTDGRIGEQTLEVVLPEGVIGAHHERDDTGAADQGEPGVGAGQRGEQAGEQKDPRLHHGGGVQIGADGRRRRHRVG